MSQERVGFHYVLKPSANKPLQIEGGQTQLHSGFDGRTRRTQTYLKTFSSEQFLTKFSSHFELEMLFQNSTLELDKL